MAIPKFYIENLGIKIQNLTFDFFPPLDYPAGGIPLCGKLLVLPFDFCLVE
jgi:hypothetical protein